METHTAFQKVHIETEAFLDGIDYTVHYPEKKSGTIPHRRFRDWLLSEKYITDKVHYLDYITADDYQMAAYKYIISHG